MKWSKKGNKPPTRKKRRKKLKKTLAGDRGALPEQGAMPLTLDFERAFLERETREKNAQESSRISFIRSVINY